MFRPDYFSPAVFGPTILQMGIPTGDYDSVGATGFAAAPNIASSVARQEATVQSNVPQPKALSDGNNFCFGVYLDVPAYVQNVELTEDQNFAVTYNLNVAAQTTQPLMISAALVWWTGAHTPDSGWGGGTAQPTQRISLPWQHRSLSPVASLSAQGVAVVPGNALAVGVMAVVANWSGSSATIDGLTAVVHGKTHSVVNSLFDPYRS